MRYMVIFLMLISFTAFAEDITGTGFSQKALFSFFEDIVTNFNLVKDQQENCNLSFLSVECASDAGSSALIQLGPLTREVSIAGIMYRSVASALLSDETLAVGTAQGTDKACYYLFSMSSAGEVYVTKGTSVASTETATVPTLPASRAPIALLLKLTDDTDFTIGTTNIGASNATTNIWYQLKSMPSGASYPADLSLSGH